MSIAFSTLTTRLSTNVPADSGVPSTAQYEQAVRDAVSDFNADVTRVKSILLSIRSGVATYSLPADFVKLVALKHPPISHSQSGQVIVITESGLVPMVGPLRETITIEGDSLRISPAPTYSATRELRYGAGHIETGTPAAYAEMSDREARIVMMLAQSYAYGYQAAVKVGSVTEYTVGDVRAKLGNAAVDLQGSASALLTEYKDAVKKYIGTLVTRG